jgi:hypothetical protein
VLATSEDAQLIASMQNEEWVGRSRPVVGTTLL